MLYCLILYLKCFNLSISFLYMCPKKATFVQQKSSRNLSGSIIQRGFLNCPLILQIWRLRKCSICMAIRTALVYVPWRKKCPGTGGMCRTWEFDKGKVIHFRVGYKTTIFCVFLCETSLFLEGWHQKLPMKNDLTAKIWSNKTGLADEEEGHSVPASQWGQKNHKARNLGRWHSAICGKRPNKNC